MDNYKVREARRDELKLLAAMRRKLGDFLRSQDKDLWELSKDEMSRQAERYSEVMDSGKGKLLVAVDAQDRPVGMIMVRLLENPRVEPGRFGRIDDAWVEPEHRRRGLMRELVRAAADYAQGQGFGLMMLDWSVKNVASERCWRGLGFSPMITVGTASTLNLLKPDKEQK